VYWSLGIHDPDFFRDHDEKDAVPKILRAKAAWAVLSFRVVDADDPEVTAAEQAAGVQLAGPRRYRFHVYRWGDESPDPADIDTVLVEMLEQAIVYVSGNTVLLQREGGPWTADSSMPT
jgi:acetylornithine deacetylase/succinyl-diaminopimelate desuccinylase-like protein